MKVLMIVWLSVWMLFVFTDIGKAQKVDWYQVLPVVGDFFDEEEDFTAVFVKQSLFFIDEEGVSWIIIIVFPEEIQNLPEKYVITKMQFMQDEKWISVISLERKNYLLAILPYVKEELKGVTAYIESNVAEHCYNLDGEFIDCENFADYSLLENYGTLVKAKSQEEKEIISWFEKAKKNNSVKKYNFALSEEKYLKMRFYNKNEIIKLCNTSFFLYLQFFNVYVNVLA